MLPTIFTSFLHGFLHNFLWFPAFSCIFMHFQWVLPVSFIFQWFLHRFFWLLSHFPFLVFPCIFPAFSNGFCTISFDRYHVFLQFLYPLRALSLYLFLFTLVFQKFYPSPSFSYCFCSTGFCTISSDRYHVFLQFLHPLRGLIQF